MPAGRLTTHALDLVSGRPAAGLGVELVRLGVEGSAVLAAVRTDADGRTDAPLVPPGALEAAEYELRFAVGDWLAAREPQAPGFLTVVPVRFAVADPEADHHVPLLFTPWAYSTYRGS